MVLVGSTPTAAELLGKSARYSVTATAFRTDVSAADNHARSSQSRRIGRKPGIGAGRPAFMNDFWVHNPKPSIGTLSANSLRLVDVKATIKLSTSIQECRSYFVVIILRPTDRTSTTQMKCQCRHLRSTTAERRCALVSSKMLHTETKIPAPAM